MNEKIGMYTKEEILKYMTDCDGPFLGRSMFDAIFEKIDKLQQENEKLRSTIKTYDGIANNLCKKVENLKQQLKDKDEKISEIIEYIKENIKAELLNGSIWIDKCKLLNILESNKED